jgi:hypothetical protein
MRMGRRVSEVNRSPSEYMNSHDQEYHVLQPKNKATETLSPRRIGNIDLDNVLRAYLVTLTRT